MPPTTKNTPSDLPKPVRTGTTSRDADKVRPELFQEVKRSSSTSLDLLLYDTNQFQTDPQDIDILIIIPWQERRKSNIRGSDGV